MNGYWWLLILEYGMFEEKGKFLSATKLESAAV
jgi:hypothetical protein